MLNVDLEKEQLATILEEHWQQISNHEHLISELNSYIDTLNAIQKTWMDKVVSLNQRIVLLESNGIKID